MVIHPTAIIPLLYNRYATPFIFLITELPAAFQEWLVNTAIPEVDSHL